MDAPFLEHNLLRRCAGLSRNELFEIANSVGRQALDAD
jgi:hypothetical protein